MKKNRKIGESINIIASRNFNVKLNHGIRQQKYMRLL